MSHLPSTFPPASRDALPDELKWLIFYQKTSQLLFICRSLPAWPLPAILICNYPHSIFLIFLPKSRGKLIETQACKELSTSYFLTLPFFEEGKGKGICVIQKFCSLFFCLFSTICKFFRGATLCNHFQNQSPPGFHQKIKSFQAPLAFTAGHKKTSRGRF